MAYQKPVPTIMEKIAVLSSDNFGRVELNKVSWDGAPGKYDIRRWYTDRNGQLQFGKGIDLTDEEAFALLNALRQRF